MPVNEEKNYLLNSVLKALNILELFNSVDHPLNLKEISETLNYPKSSCLNLIKTLESQGYITKINNTLSYRLGFKVLELGYKFRTSMPVIQYSLPVLEELQNQTHEIIYLTTHVNGRVLYLEGMYPGKRMMNYSVSGKTLPIHCTGCGKAMLAYLPEDEINYIIDKIGIPAVTKNTICTKDAMLKELEGIRKRGYSIDLEEESPGVKCIAMPILSSSGYPVAALSISGTIVSMKDEYFERYSELLSHACNSLAKHFNGFQL